MEQLNTDENGDSGSDYSFDGLCNRLRKHNVVYPSPSPESPFTSGDVCSSSPGPSSPGPSSPGPSSESSCPDSDELMPISHRGAMQGGPGRDHMFFRSPQCGGANGGAAVTGSGFRRFSVFSQPLPTPTLPLTLPNGVVGAAKGEKGDSKGMKLDGLSESENCNVDMSDLKDMKPTYIEYSKVIN